MNRTIRVASTAVVVALSGGIAAPAFAAPIPTVPERPAASAASVAGQAATTDEGSPVVLVGQRPAGDSTLLDLVGDAHADVHVTTPFGRSFPYRFDANGEITIPVALSSSFTWPVTVVVTSRDGDEGQRAFSVGDGPTYEGRLTARLDGIDAEGTGRIAVAGHTGVVTASDDTGRIVGSGIVSQTGAGALRLSGVSPDASDVTVRTRTGETVTVPIPGR
jgi:hypothetical protein